MKTYHKSGLCSTAQEGFWDTVGYTSDAPGQPANVGPIYFSSKPPQRPPDAFGNPRPYGTGYFAESAGGPADVKGYFVLDRE
jgi:hypothetical protein